MAHASANMTMDQLKAQMEAADRDLNMHYELEEAGAAPMPAIERRLEAKSRAAREAYFAALAMARERERAEMEQD